MADTATEVMEIMARALFEQQHEIRYGCAGIDLWDALDESRRADLIMEQEAAIKALTAAGLVVVSREPTRVMRTAGVLNLDIMVSDREVVAREVYKAMIREVGK